MTCRLTRQQVRSCEEDLFCPSQPLFPAQKLCYVLVPNTLLDQNQNTAFQAWAHGKQGCKQNLAQCYPLLSDYQYTSAGRYWCHEHSFCILIVFLFILLSLLRDLFFFPFFLFFSLLFFFSSFSFLYFFSFLLFSLFFFSLSLLSLFFFFSLFFPFSFSFILSFPSFFFLIFSSSFFFFNFFLITFSLPLFLVFSFFFFIVFQKRWCKCRNGKQSLLLLLSASTFCIAVKLIRASVLMETRPWYQERWTKTSPVSNIMIDSKAEQQIRNSTKTDGSTGVDPFLGIHAGVQGVVVAEQQLFDLGGV